MTVKKSRKSIVLLCLSIIVVAIAFCAGRQEALTRTLSGKAKPAKRAPANKSPKSNFAVEFGIGSGWTHGTINEISLHPGDPIDFVFRVTNISSKPVECPTVVIEPTSALDFDKNPPRKYDRTPAIADIRLKTFRNLNNGVPMQVANPAYFGISNPRNSSMGGTLNPANSQYYDSRTAALWSASSAIGLLVTQTQFDPVPSVMPIGFDRTLLLSRRFKPGTDGKFTGYIMVRGRKQLAGTVIVHVLHPD